MMKRQSAYSQILKEKQQEAEQNQPASQTVKQSTVREVGRTDSKIAVQSNNEAVKRLDSQTAKQPRIKATYYLPQEAIIAIDEMQTKQFRKSGKKPEKSELVSDAIKLLSKQLDV